MKKQDDFNKLVGRIGDSYYFCDYIFEDSNGFKGATGTVLEPVSKQQYEDDTSEDRLEERFEDCWAEAVKAKQTEQSLANYAKEVFAVNGDESVYDFSGYDSWEQLRDIRFDEDNYPCFTCTGCGRCFYSNMVFDTIYNVELWEKIKAIESK